MSRRTCAEVLDQSQGLLCSGEALLRREEPSSILPEGHRLTADGLDERERLFGSWALRSRLRVGRRLPRRVRSSSALRRRSGRGRATTGPAKRRVFEGLASDRRRRATSRATTAAGVPTFSAHDFRQRRVSLMLEQGVSSARIGKQVGHGDIATTARKSIRAPSATGLPASSENRRTARWRARRVP